MAVKLAMIFFSMILDEQLRAGAVPGHLPLPGRFQKAGFRRGHVCRRHLRHGAGHQSSPGPSTPICWSQTALAYLQTIVFILIIAVLVQLVEIILKKFMPAAVQGAGCVSAAHHHQLRGAGRDNFRELDEGYNFAESLVCAVGAGRGLHGGHGAVLRRAQTAGGCPASQVL